VQKRLTPETEGSASRSGSGQGDSSLAEFVRAHDRDRFQTALFAPAERREALFALYAFNYEVARVRESVTQPMLGQIRLQWWREVVVAAYAGAPARQHVVAGPLADLIGRIAPAREHFERIIDTRERDLADDPPADMAALEDYAEGTSARLLYLVVGALGVAEPASVAAAGKVGIGYALAGLLRAMPYHAAAGRSYIPAELSERAGLDPNDYARRRPTPELRTIAAELAEAAASHLTAARRHTEETPRGARAALLPAIIADRLLARLRQAGYNPFAPELARPDPLQSWRLFAAALRNRF
jgi:NADH dehydrogenase [ubiquinone] 1 alpha subcomplex assembly factor 6